jgi:hypothetical protein
MRDSTMGNHYEELERLRQYPALLATWTMGVAAILSRREQFVARILTRPAWTPPLSNRQPQTPAVYFNPRRVIGSSISEVCKSETGGRYLYPQSLDSRGAA